MNAARWFDVSKEGLARVIQRRGKAFAVFELVANSLDAAGVTTVKVKLAPVGGRALCELTVEDDGAGFDSLHHAFTLFAGSTKAKDPTKRGRFDLGEKLVLALCVEAEVISTTGGVGFCKDGRRRSLRRKTERGSFFRGLIQMTRAEYDDVVKKARSLIVPDNVRLEFNDMVILPRTPIAVCRAYLQTEVADADGVLRKTYRDTDIELYEGDDDIPAGMVYELGVPIVCSGDKYAYNVLQRVPLGLDRQSLPFAYLRDLRVAALNASYQTLAKADVNADWVTVATADSDCSPEAAAHVFKLRFGEKAVAYDPSDIEANSRAVAAGYNVVHGNALSQAQWENARKANVLPPAGRVTPGPKTWSGEGNPDAKPFTDWIPEEKWTDGMKLVADYARFLARKLLGRDIAVLFCSTAQHLGGASYGNGCLTFNKFRLGNDWFEQGISEEITALLLHELAHERAINHLSDEFHRECCRLGAKLVRLALDEPNEFAQFRDGPAGHTTARRRAAASNPA